MLPAFTMIATANAVRYTGATPVLVDSERDTWNLDTSRIDTAVTPRTKGIIVVHTYGHPVDLDPVLDVARRRGLWVLEDAAEAHGATYRGQPAGSIGQAATASTAPWVGLTSYFDRALALQAADRGLKEVLFSSGRGRERSNHARRAIAPVVTKLVRRAKEAGVVRDDIDTSDVPPTAHPARSTGSRRRSPTWGRRRSTTATR